MYLAKGRRRKQRMDVTKMFDLFLIFLHKGFMFFLLLFFSLLRGITNDINNALLKWDKGKGGREKKKKNFQKYSECT